MIAQPDFMDNAAGILKGDFFVLPSSLHEVLLFRDDGMTDYRGLEEMVRIINETEVQPADRLTDTVYHYDASERIFETGREFEDRMAEKALGKRESVLADLADQKQKEFPLYVTEPEGSRFAEQVKRKPSPDQRILLTGTAPDKGVLHL